MNIALEHTEEYVNGVKKNSYGDAFIRGNNGQFRSIRKHDGGDWRCVQCCRLIDHFFPPPVLYISASESL